MNATEWLDNLCEQQILNILKINSNNYYRINAKAKFIFPDDIVATIKNEYDPAYEKGGIIMFEPLAEKDNSLFVAAKILFLKNISDDPQISYNADANLRNKIELGAIERNMLPFRFHTHPTKSNDLFNEAVNYKLQQDTSDNDQIVSTFAINVENSLLRLPNILIVGNGTNCLDLFVGFYNGLISHTSFDSHKKELLSNSSDRFFNFIENRIDTPAKKVGALFGIAGILYLAIKYPKVTIPVLIAASFAIPQLIYSFQSENIFFGIARSDELEIIIPQISNEQILEYEQEALEKHRKWVLEQRKTQFEKAIKTA